ncbi:MAG: cyclic nucleotide-binding domain-containing protein, partial [Gammaproteobacteria bacterium]|nr:cyclic nucleotide-binding domain-containing protein [Gammaproteobacteria bacterium]
MSQAASSEEQQSLRALVPLHTLSDEALDELLDKVSVETVSKGQMLFREGDTDQQHVYLVAGRVALLSGKSVVERVEAGSETARFPLAHQLPRNYSVRAETRLRITRIDSRMISDLLARSQTIDYQVSDFEDSGDGDWMSLLLQSRVLQQVPAANIQRVMMSVEQVEVAKGEDLVRQGDPGDYYYMLTSGRAVVRRDNDDGKGPVELATLGAGDAFGEEALLAETPRNSTVTMLNDGMILRLSKENFLQLIQNPLLEQLNLAAASKKIADGAIWLDLRTSEEFDGSHLDGAINLPFESLRYQSESLSPDRHYVVYSSTGARAMSGAFLLAERGFELSVLADGYVDGMVVPAAPVAANADQAGDAVAFDEQAQARMREAEARAHELEAQLKQAQQRQEDAVAERDQHLDQVRDAIEQAKRKLLETEEQKREALEGQQKAYSEMEALTGNLEQLQSERTSLVERMAEIEGLDKQMQERLVKAERELIRERERAESATSSFEELTDRLNDEINRRDEERQQHAIERGELKEQLTELRMELELANADIEEMREQLVDNRSAETSSIESLQQALDEARSAHQALLDENSGMQA